MSTISPVSRIRQFPGFLSLSCSQCANALLVHELDPRLPVCRQCRRGEAEREVGKARAVIDDLVNGVGEFSVFSQLERQQQLAALGIETPAKVSTVTLREPPEDVTREEIELVCAQMDADQDRECEPFEQW
jgi:hypothetical protein